MAYELSDDPARLDVALVHRFLCEQSYWARGVAREVVARSIAGSWCVGAYDGAGQVGLARLAGDRATFAWLCDVFVLPEHRRCGLGDRLVTAALDRAAADGVRRVLLATRDAHAVYRRRGFEPHGPFMQRVLTPAAGAPGRP